MVMTWVMMAAGCPTAHHPILVATTALFLMTGWAAGDYVLHPALLNRIRADLEPYRARGGILWEDTAAASHVGDLGFSITSGIITSICT